MIEFEDEKEPVTGNAAEPSDSAEELEERRRLRRLKYLGAGMSQPLTRALIYDLLERGGVFKISFSPANPDPCLTAFYEGCRNYATEIFADVTKEFPDLYAKMLKEAQLEREKENARTKNATASKPDIGA